MIQTHVHFHAPQTPKAKLNTPSCDDGGNQYYLTLSERSNSQLHCGSCGTRFPSKLGAEKAVLPKHNIPMAVHEYRLKLQADGVKLD